MYFASAQEMEKLDGVAVEHGLEIRQMMELAGFHMVEVFARESVRKDEEVVVVCGKGNKGGDGLATARHLFNHGWSNLTVVLAHSNIKPDPAHHLALLKSMGVPILTCNEDNGDAVSSSIKDAAVIVDALIGYHLDGPPRGVFQELISLINDSRGKIISYDLPSGVDATTGECLGKCISAAATLTLALPKRAFETESGREHSGRVYLADIGIPAFLYDMIRKDSRPRFEQGLILIKNAGQ